MLHLYSYYRSSAAYRVRIALALKGMSWEAIPVNLFKQEQRQATYLEKNPQGLVPALQTGSSLLTQSLAIIEYLEELQPEPALLPSDPLAKAQIRALAYQVAMDIHPLNNVRVLNYLTSELGHSEAEKIQWLHHWMGLGFAALEDSLRQQGCDGRYCFADAPTLADLCLVPQVYNAYRFNCPMNSYPLIVSIWQHCTGLAQFIDAAPEAQTDSP
jgi:maleylpyruvate isomerase